VLADLKAFARYAHGLRGFLRHSLSSDDCRRQLEDGLQTRERGFLLILEQAVYGHPRSPYAALLRHAGVELGDIERLVHEAGVEGTLERLHDEGVYVSLDEFKGRRPIERSGLRLSVRAEDFDSPLIGAAFVGSTGGSRGPRRRVLLGFDHRAQGAIYHRLFLETFDLTDRRVGVWREGTAGISSVLGYAKVGKPVERWFSHNRVLPKRGFVKDFIFTAYTVGASRGSRMPLPWPEFVPVHEAGQVARWLADKRREGRPALLNTPPSSGVRVCLAAEELGLDIRGTFFRLGGEPFTAAKAGTIARTGVRAVSNYAMSEVGRVGVACATPTALDDLHVLTDRLAVIQREHTVAPGASVPALL